MKKYIPTILIGLGNPGEEYAHTYHNVGSLALDYLAASKGVDSATAWHEASGKPFVFLKIDPLILVKPKAFMNESGPAAREAIKFFGSDKAHIVVLHDDSDLPIGVYKYELGRGSAGHHGVESLVSALRTKEFMRVRIGIRPPAKADSRRKKASEFVLAHISPAYFNKLQSVFSEIAIKLTLNE